MRLLSVNIGSLRPIANAKASGVTGIYKTPADGPVDVGLLGLPGDAIADVKHHGGVDQAIYAYGQPDYDWWAAELGRPLPPGTFGENLTIDGLESARLVVGDRLHFDEVILEVTAPRIPCATLAARMDDPAFVRRIRAAERPGVYCSACWRCSATTTTTCGTRPGCAAIWPRRSPFATARIWRASWPS